VNATAQLLFSEESEQALNQVEPRATSGSEVQMEAWMAQQPALDRWGLMGAVIVDNQM
jgi:hypothetical protein